MGVEPLAILGRQLLVHCRRSADCCFAIYWIASSGDRRASTIIVVSVVIDVVKQIEAKMAMHEYERA